MKTTLLTRISRPARSAFTLVELLVVVAIIALLAGIAFPSYSAIMKKMKKDQARTLAMSLVNSCKGYYAEYSKYPLPQDGTASEVSPIRTDEILTGTLLGSAVEQNPKKINFLPDLKPVERGHGFGLLTEGETASIVDPWGEAYYVLMDADYNNNIENPNSNSTTTKLYQGVLVYSAGPDKDPSTFEDNVMSWDSGKSMTNPQAPTPTGSSGQ
jgi:prepilin-type N-terminal cleavage/methylation domain-containing protein